MNKGDNKAALYNISISTLRHFLIWLQVYFVFKYRHPEMIINIIVLKNLILNYKLSSFAQNLFHCEIKTMVVITNK